MWHKCRLTGFTWYSINSSSYPVFDDFCLHTQQRLGTGPHPNKQPSKYPDLQSPPQTTQSPAAGNPDSTGQGTAEISARKPSTAQDEVRLEEPQSALPRLVWAQCAKAGSPTGHSHPPRVAFQGCWGVLGCPAPWDTSPGPRQTAGQLLEVPWQWHRECSRLWIEAEHCAQCLCGLTAPPGSLTVWAVTPRCVPKK